MTNSSAKGHPVFLIFKKWQHKFKHNSTFQCFFKYAANTSSVCSLNVLENTCCARIWCIWCVVNVMQSDLFALQPIWCVPNEMCSPILCVIGGSPLGSKFFNFHAVLGKKFAKLAHPRPFWPKTLMCCFLPPVKFNSNAELPSLT